MIGAFFSLIPLNALPLALIFLREKGLLQKIIVMNDYLFLVLIAALLIFTLSMELIKASMFAPTGSSAWVDFAMSLLFFMGLFGYIVYVIVKKNHFPSTPILLVLEAQFFDVLVGFYITISNARRDFNTKG